MTSLGIALCKHFHVMTLSSTHLIKKRLFRCWVAVAGLVQPTGSHQLTATPRGIHDIIHQHPLLQFHTSIVLQPVTTWTFPSTHVHHSLEIQWGLGGVSLRSSGENSSNEFLWYLNFTDRNKANLRVFIAVTSLVILLKPHTNQCFNLCDLAIWQITSRNNRETPSYFLEAMCVIS